MYKTLIPPAGVRVYLVQKPLTQNWYASTQHYPPPCASRKVEDVEQAVDLYRQFLPTNTFRAECLRWQSYWSQQPADVKRPDRIVDALLVACELRTYPTITLLLRIFATLPVTTATGDNRSVH